MEIGVLAGKIWEILEKSSGMTASALVKSTGSKSNDVYMALGWLLREDKLEAVKSGNCIRYSLK
ncbi:MAG: winged helix-turn-helix domain-containing protein [Candidatus Neomarinimicrobiota bacterium]